MTPRYSALVQMVDYVEDARHIAVGDLLCVDGGWQRVSKVALSPHGVPHMAVYIERIYPGGASMHEEVSLYSVARIPGVLIELLSSAKDPYR